MQKRIIYTICLLLWGILFAQLSNAQSCWYTWGNDEDGIAVPWSTQVNCDDCSSGAIRLGFDFDFFGSSHDTLWMNSNGNLSFENAYNVYNPSSFPNKLASMIAPFYADVDNRATTGKWGYYIDSADGYAIFSWEDSRHYFGPTSTKENSFQVLITDGSRPDLTGPGNNVCFNYAGMDWTTGSASGGTGGFGGIPAFVGLNKGDSLTGMEYGRFDAPGTYYDGAGGFVDEVDHLDTLCFCFDADAGVLPVTLTEYMAAAMPNHTVRLDWMTATETQNDYFIIERSGSDLNFKEIAKIQGSGNSITALKYNHIDEQPLPGKNYYRLTQVDFNGEFEVLGTREVEITDGVEQFGLVKFAPNPAKDLATVVITSDKDEKITYTISTLDGRAVYKGKHTVQPGFNSVDLNLTKFEESGIMILTMEKEGQILTTKFVKQ